jgi:hypothetical protein
MRSNAQRLRRAVAGASVVAALTAPAAAAASPADPAVPGPNPSTPSQLRAGDPRPAGIETASTAADGFDWGDAGIGAMTVLGAGALGAGAALGAGRLRSRQHPVA